MFTDSSSWIASKAGTYAYVNPVVAVILGYLILNEVVTAQTIIAASIILSGVVLVQISKVKILEQKVQKKDGKPSLSLGK